MTSASSPGGEEQSPLPLGIGCALVLPIAFFGTEMIAEHPGPPGRFGILEFFGWWGLCAAVSYWSAALLRKRPGPRRNRLLRVIAGTGVPIAFGLLTWADVHPDTPGHVKLWVEYSLQVLGVPALGLLVGFFCWIAWSSRRR